ncbi:MAG: sulfite exporter TauE/SafE family protein [Acidobacteria bacterium]|nr:MAG: sulfite exporter TauE/SafE family protein [Acidobacteriota bacterium]
MNFGSELLTFAVGAFAGGLGALLGIGGGVILIPFLNIALGLTFNQSSGISLITIIATSSAASAAKGRMQLVNLRLGMVLEVFTTSGGVIGLWLFGKTDSHTVRIAFAWTLVAIAMIMLSRISKRNVLDPTAEIGQLGGRYFDKETGGEVAYRLKRAPVAFVMSFLAGVVSNFGIGGGILKVPALNAWCGVPIRAAAATSSLMLGATAFVVATDRFRHGEIIPELAAAAVLGVLGGTQVGVWAQHRFHPKTHKLVMVALLLSVAALYFSGVGKR